MSKKMTILAIDDKAEEREMAKAAIEAAGHVALVVETMEEFVDALPLVDGAITDLHFSPFGTSSNKRHAADYQIAPPPAGLLTVIAAMHLRVPVVICTSAGTEDGGHHSRTLQWVFDGFVRLDSRNGRKSLSEAKREQLGVGDIDWSSYWEEGVDEPPNADLEPEFPFGWEERKDWAKALSILLERLGAGQHPPLKRKAATAATT